MKNDQSSLLKEIEFLKAENQHMKGRYSPSYCPENCTIYTPRIAECSECPTEKTGETRDLSEYTIDFLEQVFDGKGFGKKAVGAEEAGRVEMKLG